MSSHPREELVCQRCSYHAYVRTDMPHPLPKDPHEYVDVVDPGVAEDLHHLGREHFPSLVLRSI
jgi:hypothetical protein